MLESKKIRTQRWSHVFLFLGLIYSTLYIVRPLCTFLRSSTPFPVLVNSLCIVLLISLLVGFRIKVHTAKISTYLILTLVLVAYLYGLLTIQYPEEKVHFIEYGFLAFLIFRALEIDVQGMKAYGCALLLILIFGWIDEGIQYCLPNRYYQIEDVLLNFVSGILGLLLVFAFKNK